MISVWVRHICDMSNWYTMLTEALCCGPCTKAARRGEGSTVGWWLAWDSAILSQLSEAHRAMFPAILTSNVAWTRALCNVSVTRLKGTLCVKCGSKYRRITLATQGPVHHTPHESSGNWWDGLCIGAQVSGSSSSKRAALGVSPAPCLP
ncbi:uncharacterized protein LOC131355726 isoform X2 [Hemibagrus wyckioides]|uniref:uncharacterized protein LOC131355726 isoform X2 n=1 Tax=Hemibagrus wyckioides TaxID=337641 RepID=UPI00266B46CA|nr:uncharacterized protein LOC131355726 isoform X2 [Hemibagrus wyckioides]